MNKAQEIIALYNREYGSTEQSNFRTIWQDTADLMYPRENQIIDQTSPGENKTDRVYDVTAIFESQNMAAGLAQNLVPPGQKFFNVAAVDRNLREAENVKRYLSYGTEITHDVLFSSNFMLQLTETLRSLVVFGTGNIYSEYTNKLNFKDFAISKYSILQSADGSVDTMILKYPLTAKQATEEFENPGKLVTDSMLTEEGKTKVFDFIHIVRPRKERNINLSDNMNMPFESLYVCVKSVEVVDEGGFEEFPYHVPRWVKSSTEKFGRGQGTEILPQVKVLNQMMLNFVDVGNRFANQPLEILESFEGDVDITPGAQNTVQEIGSIKAIDQNALGNYPYTKDNIEMQRQVVKDAFFSSAFAPLTDLSGDRRTTLEIRQRVQESFKKIGSPIGRIQSELFTPLIERVVSLLLRNGVLPPPPEELAGQGFKIEYIGPMALALKSSEVEASQQWISLVGAMEQMTPPNDIDRPLDHVDFNDSIRRMARTFGVNEEDIASQEEVAAKRQIRADALAKAEAAQLATLATEAYSKGTKAPEEGSPSELVMGNA